MKRLLLLTVLAVGTALSAQAQNPCSQGQPYRGCKACGSAKSAKGQNLNVLKNRGAKATSPKKITVEEIRDPANDSKFNPSRQVSVTAYVASVDPGGNKESCNCGRGDLRDVHINIVTDPSEVNDKAKYVVVEFTPRWEKKFGLNDSDYASMKKGVADQIVGKWVKFEGWMLSDSFHVSESKNTAKSSTPTCQDNGSDPKPCVWRATTWEIHPVTKYTVVTGP